MPYLVNWEPPSGVRLQLSGVVNAAEFVAAVKQVHTSQDYDSLRYVIDDLSDLESFDVSPEVVMDVFAASIGAGITNPRRRIYVVTTDAKVLAYLEKVQTSFEGALPITRYSSLSEARKAIAEAAEEAPPFSSSHF